MDPGTLTNSSIVYPDIQHEETGCISLQPLILTICFSGMLPEGLLQENIPIQISVSIDEEYGVFTTPVINTVSMDVRDSDSWQVDLLPSSDCCSPSDDSIPFLPLPPAFDSCNRENWASLSKEIETWLVLEVDPESPLWTWGHDAFWLAFIGAYPYFPRDRWPMWDSQVPLQGTFIEA
ncbi:uncharacterized protein EDB93DRAFT_1103970 [Suillus bovinus]|uniref:uncharacterized protein n=1 Tax=Suillus bovinus TaxID=48563 RepID=UPI001B88647C|nr:uncharacterized protein EDB93DRAFT_1103970 [Suillus bovinus]KAG2147894.1 hypothetical protein EDB93DRAFT_1103970 [Suillus bovinus]